MIDLSETAAFSRMTNEISKILTSAALAADWIGCRIALRASSETSGRGKAVYSKNKGIIIGIRTC